MAHVLGEDEFGRNSGIGLPSRRPGFNSRPAQLKHVVSFYPLCSYKNTFVARIHPILFLYLPSPYLKLIH